METLINNIIASFDIRLMISITVLSYGILKSLEFLVFKTSKQLKRLLTIILSAILSYIYYKYLDVSLEQVIPTYLLSVAFYDLIVKHILKFLNINYKK